MATRFSRGVAARAWCCSKTKKKVMDVDLAEEFANILDKYIEALQWCSGSCDFQIGGKARRGWNRMVVPLIRAPKEN